ncbi:hypothetical protein AB5N19_05017 [Seiridium cardinale]
MPSFGRIGRHSNRSQHNLVEQQLANAPPSLVTSSSSGVGVGVGPGSGAASANTPPSASSTALSSSESFQVDTRVAQQQAQNKQLQQSQQPQHQHQQRLQEHSRSLGQPPPLTAQYQQQQQPGPPQVYAANPGAALTSNHNPTSSIPNSSAATATATAYGNSRQQQQLQQQQKSHHQDFADSVSRSQSTRYPQVSPLQTQQPFALASSSADNLPDTISSPLLPQAQAGYPIGPHQQQHPNQTAPTETKQSTRKLIKKILQGASASRAASSAVSSPDPHQHQHHNSYDNTAGLARRPSKRVNNPFPPSVRTSVSLEQQQIPDWQQQPPQQQQQQQQQQSSSQASPLQGVGETAETYNNEKPLATPELRLQNPQSQTQGPQPPRPHPHQNTIRQVSADVETSPYSPEDLAFQQHQAQAQLQAQLQAQGGQQQRYGQIVVDPAQPQEQYQQYTNPQAADQTQYPQGNPPRLYTGHLASQQSNPETISQLSYESPVTESDQRSTHIQSTQTSPAVNYPQQDLSVTPSQQPVSPLPSIAQPVPMAPPSGGPPSRRSGDNDKTRSGNIEPPPGPPPGYRHSQAMNTMGSLPPTPGPAQANREFRASNVPERQAQQQQFDGGNEAGRHSPQPSTGGERDADPEKQFKDLLTKYKNVKRLYFDGKGQIEQLTNQVEQLQNAVANQRISQSRTALDDSEYTTRFNRLNGAINNLSFNIRKDWRTLPPWINRYVSTEALKTGKQEMTAVGRAVVTRWVVEEIFNKCFHPGLNRELSRQLKEIEQNIRRFSYTLNSQEEFEALTSKVVSWRMATLEGLQHTLQSHESQELRVNFTESASDELTAHIYEHLVESRPAGVAGSVAMIVELAVGIAANLSLESRDVAVTYPLPGDTIQPDFMELEKAGLPPLPDNEDAEDSGQDGDKSKRDKKSGMLSMLGGVPPPGSRKSSVVSNTDMDASPAAVPAPPAKDSSKVRFAGFVAVEVRGRQVLVKAPVWNLG